VPRPSIAGIKSAVADEFKITVSELTGRRRNPKFAWPRALAMMLSRKLTRASYPRIGRAFDGRHHSTVLHDIARWHDLVDFKPELYDRQQRVERSLDLG
jgi:chromosomal replication initiator protein